MIARFLTMLVWVVALIASAFSTAGPPPVAAGYIARAWGTADGLPQNSVTSIVETRDGYLWVGTFGGLVRFDGNAFTVFDPGNTPGLASARIVALREDQNGVLWIGTEAGLTKYEKHRFLTHTTRDGLPHDEITSLLVDRRGRLWIATGGGLVRRDGGRYERVWLGGLPDVGLAMAETPDGDVWVSTWNGVARFHGDHAALVVGRLPVNAMLVDSRGRLWAGSERLARWDEGRGQFVEVPLEVSFRKPDFVKSLAEAPDGTLWIGAAISGVYAWRDGMTGAYNTANGLDKTAPVLTVANVVAEATGPNGAAAAFSAAASDAIDAHPVVSCALTGGAGVVSGAVFPIGSTLVSCTATDASGNSSSAGFTVTVRDTTAPALTLPASMAVDAIGLAGAPVTFTASAGDLVDGSVGVSCAPASGSSFPVGTTPVSCSAIDRAGNRSSGSFSVTVREVATPGTMHGDGFIRDGATRSTTSSSSYARKRPAWRRDGSRSA